MKVHVQLAHGISPSTTGAQWAEGIAPDPVAYGFHHAERTGVTVTYSTDHAEGKIGAFAQKACRRLFGFDLMHAWRNRKAIADADIVWTMTEIEYLSVLALSFLYGGGSPPPIIGNNVWLFNQVAKMSSFKRWLYRRLVARASLLTVHSRSCLALAQREYPDARIELMYFGVSEETFWREDKTISPHTPIRVVAAGNDLTRDWNTLFEAFGNDARFELIVVSKRIPEELKEKYLNLRLPVNPSRAEFIELYRSADFVAIPMVENVFSGITVALEAVAAGSPVLCSRTGGVPTYFSEAEVLYVPVGDAAAMKAAALGATPREQAELVGCARTRWRSQGYSTKTMVERYLNLSHQLLNAR